MFLINSLRALLSSRIAPLLDNSRLALIRQHVVPLLKRLSYPAVSLFNHVLRSHSEGITSSITEQVMRTRQSDIYPATCTFLSFMFFQLLLQSIVRASTTLSSRTAAESELLRQKGNALPVIETKSMRCFCLSRWLVDQVVRELVSASIDCLLLTEEVGFPK